MEIEFAPLNGKSVLRRARECLSYDPDAGSFVWLKPPHNHTRLLGKSAGSTKTGYVMIKIDGQKYKAHRLAWLMITGEWPNHRIDHADGNPFNNKWENLRPCDQTLNNANRKRNAGKALPKGVRQIRGRFQARIKVKNKLISLGCFSSADEAQAAYAEAAKKHFGSYARMS